jgi:hypothetical protein
MSNKIFGTDIVDQSASVEVKKLQTDLQSLLNTFIQTSGAVDIMRKALSNVTDYNNASDAIGKNTKALDEMQRVKNQIIALQRQIAVMNSDEYKSLVALREERNKNNRELREEAKATLYASEAYKRLEAEYSKAAREAKNLGAELGTNSKQFVDAAQKANLLNDKLKAIDAGMGVHTRNVGNYTSATHSLSQVLREMPAFTYSAQTGLMGISNNLPILIDQFKALRLETGSTSQALKIFAGSIFSFPNLFTIAIGLITIFYDKIFETGKAAKEAAEDIKTAGDAVQQAYNSTEFKDALTNVTELETRIDLAKKGFADKDQTVKFYNETIGKTTGLVKDLDEAETALVKNSDQYLKMILYRAAANLALEAAAKKAVEAEQARLKGLEQIDPEKGKYGGFLEDIKHLASDDGKSMAEAAVDNVNEMVGGIQKEGQKLEDIGKQFLKDSLSIANAMNFNFNENNKPEKKKKDKKEKTHVVDIPKDLTDEEIQDLKKYYDDLNKWIAKIAAEYTADPIIQQSILGDIAENMPGDPTTEAQARDIANALKERIQQQLDDKNNKALKIRRIELDMQAVQMGASFLSSLNDIIYNAEIASIERRDRKLKDSYDQRKQLIENSYSIQADREKQLKKLEAERAAQQRGIDNQRRAADRRRALTNKGLAVAEIIANTALAVIKAFTEGDPYTKAGRAAFAAAIGAVSLAKALSVQIPAYKDGTGPDGHKGGLAIVGDGGVPEYIQEPGKKGYWSKPFAEIVDLPAKTIVTPPEKLLQNLMYKTMASLGKMGGKITSETFAEQMMKDYESLSNEMKETRKVLQAKKLSVTINGDLAHLIRMKELIK